MTPPPPPPPSPRRFAPDRTDRIADPLLVTCGVVAGAAVVVLLTAADPPDPARPPVVFGSLLVGLLLPRLHWHHYRVLGLAPVAATAAAITAAVVGPTGEWCHWAAGAFSLFLGLTVGAILRFRDGFRADSRRFFGSAAAGVLAGGAVGAAYAAAGRGSVETFRWLFLGASVLLAVQAWVTLARPWVEFTSEVIVWVMYDIRSTGPGLTAMPHTGPCLVIANHAAWFDPLFLSKVFQRPNTPVMTSRFYNIWFLKPLLKYITKVIVVPEKPLKRDAPEVREMIAALDAGHVVVLFPEGYLRRTEERFVKRFGQGVWQILAARPDTPVIACWIEGGWGSFVSYFNGPPTKNKRPDLRRRIVVGASAPETVPPELTADNLATRYYLMNKVLAARAHLGLPPAPPAELPARDDASEADDEAG